MALHTARLIFTILFLIFALAGLVSGFWLQALFWALVAFAVGYPFLRGGRLDLYYEDAPTRVVVFQPAPTGGAGECAPPGGPAAPMPGGAPPVIQALLAQPS